MPVSGGDQVDRDGCRTRPAHQAKIGRGLTEHHAEASSCAGRFAVQGCPVAVKGIPSNARRESKIFTLLPALSLSGKGPYRSSVHKSLVMQVRLGRKHLIAVDDERQEMSCLQALTAR